MCSSSLSIASIVLQSDGTCYSFLILAEVMFNNRRLKLSPCSLSTRRPVSEVETEASDFNKHLRVLTAVLRQLLEAFAEYILLKACLMG